MLRVQGPGGVGEDKLFHPEAVHEADRRRDLLRTATLVKMHATLGHQHAASRQTAKDKTPRVTRHRGRGQAGDLLVGHTKDCIHIIDQRAEAGA